MAESDTKPTIVHQPTPELHPVDVAMSHALAQAIEEHRRWNQPMSFYIDGKITFINPFDLDPETFRIPYPPTKPSPDAGDPPLPVTDPQ